MDGIHDLGGKRGFGHIKLEADLRPFPERWHGAVFTMINTLAASGITQNIDQFRHAVERIDPACYLTHGYYGRWLGAAVSRAWSCYVRPPLQSLSTRYFAGTAGAKHRRPSKAPPARHLGTTLRNRA